jgi:MFS family permease
VPAPRLIVLLCAITAANTVSIGAFPALLPEVGTSAQLADWQLGAVAGAFGFARMLTDVPSGLFMTHHLPRALVLGPVTLLIGAALIGAGGGSFPVLLLGRTLMGAGHTLATLGSLTAILRHHAGTRLASALAATEFAAMLGVLAGAGLTAVLPRAVTWNLALVLASAPVLLSLALLPALLRELPQDDGAGRRPLFARSAETAAEGKRGTLPGVPSPTEGKRGTLRGVPLGMDGRWVALLAGTAGAAVAVSYATLDQFVIPVRGSREFALDRGGIARLLMLGQVADIVTLLPLGRLADRRGATPVLGGILLVFALGIALVAFGTLPMMTVGCVLYGMAMAGWTLPLGILRSVTPPSQIAWRTALYRVAVDGGMSFGPLAAGLLVAQYDRALPAALVFVLIATGVAMLARARFVPR